MLSQYYLKYGWSKAYFFCFLLFGQAMFSPLATLEKRRGYDQVRIAGDVGQIAVPLFAVMVTLAHRDYRGMRDYAGSFGTTIGSSLIIKPIVNAERPDGGSMSFPSGHTAAAMGGAAFLQMRYGMRYGIPAYIVASYVGFSRVYAQRHWFLDVLAGTSLALAANTIFTKPLSENYRFIPVLTQDRVGICVSWEW